MAHNLDKIVNNLKEPSNGQQPMTPDLSNDYWKKIAMQKYLVGEIDLHTLKTILTIIEDDGKKENVHSEMLYR